MIQLSRMAAIVVLHLSVSAFFSVSSFALPPCYDFDRQTQVKNSNPQVLEQQRVGSQEWHRGLISGVVVRQLPDRTEHSHFLIDMNGDGKADLEVIHQNNFGYPNRITIGQKVEVCGDYKNQKMDSVQTFVHWTHCNPGKISPTHPHGWLAIDGVLYGATAPIGEPACSHF